MATVIALYEDRPAAFQAVQDLASRGFSSDNVSVISREGEGRADDQRSGGAGGGGQRNDANRSSGAGERGDPRLLSEASLNRSDDDSKSRPGLGGLGIGAAAGATAGLLGSLALLALPGVGPIVAVGPLIAGIVAGSAAVGGLIGALVDLGLSEAEAATVEEGLRDGGTMVAVRTDDRDRAREAQDVLGARNPVNLRQRARERRQQRGSASSARPALGAAASSPDAARASVGGADDDIDDAVIIIEATIPMPPPGDMSSQPGRGAPPA
ncbi:MAG: hypothetical protein QOF78_4610 [Phycisphaerales bacterium]|jgi:hypothetical protein|nr:hypothetical protein [Phycisphaerales bacterium]